MRNSGLVGVGVSPHRGVNPREYGNNIGIFVKLIQEYRGGA